jgi:S1-C subfamily serine protease
LFPQARGTGIMKHVMFGLVFLFTLTDVLHSQETLVTTDGKRYPNYEVVKTEADRLMIVYRQGERKVVATVSMSVLPPEIQKRYDYSPEKARKTATERAERNRKSSRVRNRSSSQVAKSEAAEYWVEVIQVVAFNRVLASVYSIVETEVTRNVTKQQKISNFYPYKYKTVVEPETTIVRKRVLRHELVCIVVDNNNLVDGSIFKASLYSAGRYSYEAVAGHVKTVLQFAVTPELARKSEGQAIPDNEPGEPERASPISSGTGFFAASRRIVTCDHVVGSARSIEVIDRGGRRIPVRVWRRDAKHDIAILEPIDEDISFSPFLRFSETSPQMGMKVFTIGYPRIDLQGVAPKLTEGIVSSISGVKDSPVSLQIQVPVQPGNSGGPLFTTRGEVVGIVSAGLSARATIGSDGSLPQTVNYAVRYEYVEELLGASKPKSKGHDIEESSALFERVAKSVCLVIAH